MPKRAHTLTLPRAGGTAHLLPKYPLADQMEMVELLTGAAFGAVFESSGEALLLVDRQGLIHRSNPRAYDLLELPGAPVPRENLADFLSEQSAAGFISFCARYAAPSAHGSHLAESFEATLSTGFPIRVILRAQMPKSHDLLLCLENGSGGQSVEEKSRQLEAELLSVLESVAAGIILFDPQGRVRFSNARFAQLFGLHARSLENLESFEELEQLLANLFRNPESFSSPWKSFAAGDGQPAHDELEITRPARRVLERFSRPVLDAQGCEAGWLELYYDITGERQIQSKLLQTEKMAALGQLVSGIAHELNNPLTAIMGYAQLLLGHGLLPPQLSEANKVFQEAERARRIVKNLLYFARENKPERMRVDLNEIVERTLALRSYELKVENIVVECELSPDLPETLGDPYQLQQVVLNLLVNAEQALLQERGQGHVWLRTHRLPGEKISLEVSDDGPGIPPEIASRIFDPFFTTKASGVGTGLGLSIVYGIVHQHGGEVAFENQPGAGVKFLMELPVISIPAEARPAAFVAPDPGEAGSVPAGRILVVEDEPTVAQVIVDVLREEGHQIEAVLDSREGLTRISRTHFDLVICDLRMPRLDGPAFYETLVSAGSPVRNRIIFVTGDTLAPRTLEFLEAHALPYLAKPFLVEELKLAVNRMLEQIHKDSAASEQQASQRAQMRGAGERT
jgi:signal transduction histidine kinase/FixJ family two-component response regulator